MLLSNGPIEKLTEESDLLGLIPKANSIKFFLEHHVTTLNENKMVALYGEWGTGKTTLMKYLSDNLAKELYKPIFFEAWKHEKDDNLGLSIVELLNNELDQSEIAKEFFKTASSVLKGFLKGITLKFPAPLPGAEVEFSGKEMVESVENDINSYTSRDRSYYHKIQEFQKSFIKVESALAKKFQLSDSGKIIIFIDDLDRCEPSNVIDLLSIIKLFFTYGERTIFMCGVDRDAVAKAVKTRYSDVVKSEEYLEKIFDVSFTLWGKYNLEKLIKIYFSSDAKIKGKKIYAYAEDFFKAIGMSNPRHIKKVMNKYSILQVYKKHLNGAWEYFPNISTVDTEGNLFETLIVLFVIILHEFNKDSFKEVIDSETRISSYTKATYENKVALNPQSNSNHIENSRSEVKYAWNYGDIYNKGVDDFIKYLESIRQTSNAAASVDHIFKSLAVLFMNNDIGAITDEFGHRGNSDVFFDSLKNTNNKIIAKFFAYLKTNENTILNSGQKYSDYKINDFLNIPSLYL